jgi:hypothetical protein
VEIDDEPLTSYVLEHDVKQAVAAMMQHNPTVTARVYNNLCID